MSISPPICAELIKTEHRSCTKKEIMERSIAHFENLRRGAFTNRRVLRAGSTAVTEADKSRCAKEQQYGKSYSSRIGANHNKNAVVE